MELRLGVEQQDWTEDFRLARRASAVHLDAVLKVDGAKALRLAHLRDQLPGDADGTIELQIEPGTEPLLWLDASHHISMAPDAKTYRLSFVGENRLDVLHETESPDEALSAARNVLAHAVFRRSQFGTSPAFPGQSPYSWGLPVLVYVWFTGIVTGMAGLALWSIYLN
jgi:hypothetical protein